MSDINPRVDIAFKKIFGVDENIEQIKKGQYAG
jgi:hypothetical protein